MRLPQIVGSSVALRMTEPVTVSKLGRAWPIVSDLNVVSTALACSLNKGSVFYGTAGQDVC